jgi:hypothetical protein
MHWSETASPAYEQHLQRLEEMQTKSKLGMLLVPHWQCTLCTIYSGPNDGLATLGHTWASPARLRVY